MSTRNQEISGNISHRGTERRGNFAQRHREEEKRWRRKEEGKRMENSTQILREERRKEKIQNSFSFVPLCEYSLYCALALAKALQRIPAQSG
jgi:hypothetical protein